MRGILLGSTGTRRPTMLDLRGFRDLVDPRVDRDDSLLERDVHARTSPCGGEVDPPMLMRHNCARAMCVRSVRAHGHRQHEPQRLPPQQPEVRATSGGLPCGPGHSSKRSTTSRGRSLIDAGESCGSVHAWSFCAIWNRNASVARVSGLARGSNSDGPPPVDNLSRCSLVARNVSMYD